MTRILVTAPFLIPPTHISWMLMNEVVKYAKSKGIEVEFLQGPMATRVPYSYSAPKYDVIFYGGHGSTDALIGETIVPPWMMDKYLAPIVKDKIVVAVPCCLSASELGPACIRAGAKAYIGAVDSMYAGFGNEDHDYLKDWIDHHMVLYKALLDGETVGEAVSRYRERGQYYIRLYQANPRWADSDYHIHAFSENIRVITVLGDPTARVVPARGGYELLAMALPLAVAIPGIPPLKKLQSSSVTHQELKFEIPKEVYPMLSFFAPLVAVALSPLVGMAVEAVKKRVVG